MKIKLLTITFLLSLSHFSKAESNDFFHISYEKSPELEALNEASGSKALSFGLNKTLGGNELVSTFFSIERTEGDFPNATNIVLKEAHFGLKSKISDEIYLITAIGSMNAEAQNSIESAVDSEFSAILGLEYINDKGYLISSIQEADVKIATFNSGLFLQSNWAIGFKLREFKFDSNLKIKTKSIELRYLFN
ncbi:MAG: hypothetical protein P8M71_09100 [Pseudomonadales bacterium]|nr:hypothetical protein [Pseudomonadales bacterium]